MQSVSSIIWTRVAVSIPYDDNHYTTGTSVQILMLKQFYFKQISLSYKQFQFQAIQFVINTQFKCQNSSISHSSLSINTQFICIWSRDSTLSGSITPG